MRPAARERRPRRQSARERANARRAAQGLPPLRRRGCLPFWLPLAFAAVLIIALSLGLQRAFQALDTVQRNDPRQSTDQASLPPGLDRPFTLLLIGVDLRAESEEGVRSDTLILVRVDPGAGWAAMLSIPRDSVVVIPNVGLAKINRAYSYGYNNAATLYGPETDPVDAGAAMAAEVVSEFLDLPIDYLAQVDFQGFERLVDTLGGVAIDVAEPILDPTYPTADYGVERIFIPAGLQIMDGATALRFARSRHASSDFDRSRRQQQVLTAILRDVQARGLLDQAALLPELVADLEASVRTTLPLDDLSSLQALVALARTIRPEAVQRLSINPSDVAISAEDGSDLYWDEGDLRALVGRFLRGPNQAEAPAPLRIQVQNGTDVRGLAGRLSNALIGAERQINPPNDALRNYEQSLIIDYSGQPERANQLADLLGLPRERVRGLGDPNSPPRPLDTDLVVIVGADYPMISLLNQ